MKNLIEVINLVQGEKMTFSKFRYAIASLLLIGASSLLVSCVGGTAAVSKSQSPSKIESVEISGCIVDELEDSEVPVTPKKTSKKPKKAAADNYADCIATE
ncbi:MAG: hypothetical protein KAI83_00010 [Thiomargarita sp.]|nr:hypothetical protein [Thiomargarita sp.]